MTASDGWVRRDTAYRAVVHGWPEPGLLACSGGVDSSALLVLGGIAVRRGEIAPFVVVHVDHRTRPESAAEGEAVERLAGRFGLRTIRAAIDAADCTNASSSPEDRLRWQRYAALARIASELDTNAIVTAHTRNDQIETILMKLLSGAGGLATAGMALRSTLTMPTGVIEIHRPLLQITRAELLVVLRRADVAPLTDSSNLDRSYRRNALRHDVIPLLQQVIPGFESALMRSVTLASRDADALDALAGELAAASVSCLANETRVDRSVVRESHPALATRIIRMAAGRLMPDNQRELSFERIEAVRAAADGRTGATIELPYGVVASIERTEIVFERRNL